jgi:hypothetical protein
MIQALHVKNPALSNREIADVVGCSRRLVRMIRNTSEDSTKHMPRILLFDIETAPLEVYVWHLWKNVVSPGMVIKDRSMLSWSAKWLFSDKIFGEVVSAKEAFNREDSSILSGLWTLLNDADIVIAHNGNGFDVKISNARFALNGINPPMPYRTIDTLLAARRVFNVSSFKLDDLNAYFGLDMKMEHEGMSLWRKCVNHDTEALRTMLKYNKRDVVILEELYLKIRPWIRAHPNLGLYIDTDKEVCTNCGNDSLNWAGYYYTPAGRYRSFRCDSCKAIGRSRVSDLDKETRAKLLLSIAA